MPFPHTNFCKHTQKPDVVKTVRKIKDELGSFQFDSVIFKKKITFLG